MDTETPTRLAHHLGRLDRPRRRDLVAALFRARGFETTVDGDTVIARGPADTRRIHVGSAATAPRAADLVVDPAGGSAPAPDQHVIDDGRLAEMLRYAVDAEDTRTLCEQYLGAPPEDLPAPLSHRIRRRASVIGPAVPALLVLGTLLVVVATMAVALPTVDSPTVDDGQAEPAESGGQASSTPGPFRSVLIPPAAYPPSPGDLGNESVTVDVGDGVLGGHAAP